MIENAKIEIGEAQDLMEDILRVWLIKIVENESKVLSRRKIDLIHHVEMMLPPSFILIRKTLH